MKKIAFVLASVATLAISVPAQAQAIKFDHVATHTKCEKVYTMAESIECQKLATSAFLRLVSSRNPELKDPQNNAIYAQRVKLFVDELFALCTKFKMVCE